MMNKKIALIGGGGFAYEVLEVAAMLNHDVVGYFAEDKSSFAHDYIGTPDTIHLNQNNFDAVFLAFGATDARSQANRWKLIDYLSQHSIKVETLVSPWAKISKGVKIGEGSFVAHNVCLSTYAALGKYNLLNTSAVIGHHTVLGDNNIVSPCVFVGGGVSIGNNNILGASVNILQGIKLGDNCLVGMGSNVFRSLKDNTIVWPSLNKSTRKVSGE